VNFRVSVPITSFLSAPALTVHDLYRRLHSWSKIPQGKGYCIELWVHHIFCQDGVVSFKMGLPITEESTDGPTTDQEAAGSFS